MIMEQLVCSIMANSDLAQIVRQVFQILLQNRFIFKDLNEKLQMRAYWLTRLQELDSSFSSEEYAGNYVMQFHYKMSILIHLQMRQAMHQEGDIDAKSCILIRSEILTNLCLDVYMKTCICSLYLRL